MKKYLAIPLVLAAIALGGITACNRSTPQADSTQTPAQTNSTQANSTQSTTDNTASTGSSQSKAYQTTERKHKREGVRKQIEALLTQDQVKQLETKLQQGEKMRQAVTELNLTPEQNTKVQALLKTAYANRQKSAEAGSPQ